MWGYKLFVNQRYDAIWIVVPQVANSSQPYSETLRRRPAQAVPFVWNPIFLSQRSQGFAHHGEYRPQRGRSG